MDKIVTLILVFGIVAFLLTITDYWSVIWNAMS